MITSLFRSIKKIVNNIQIYVIRRRILSRITFTGKHLGLRSNARVNLKYGSTKADVVVEDNCEIFGILNSFHHGKIVMREWSKLGPNSSIDCVNYIEIGKDTAISYNVKIIDNNNHPVNPEDRRYMRHTPHKSEERAPQYSANAPIIIGENVLVGANSRICKGVTIGDNAIIAAHAVVTKNVPANAIAAGNPARIVKENIDQSTTPIFPLKNK